MEALPIHCPACAAAGLPAIPSLPCEHVDDSVAAARARLEAALAAAKRRMASEAFRTACNGISPDSADAGVTE